VLAAGVNVPGVPAEELQSVVLRFGLDDPAAPRTIDDSSWTELLSWAQAHNLVGQLWQAVGNVAVLSSGQRTTLEAAYEEVALPALAIEASAIETHRLLADAGIEWRALKGFATSHLLYTDVAQRSSRDIDILVHPDDLARTLDALAPVTAAPAEVQAGPVRSAMLKERQITDTRGVAIDIHQAIEGCLINSRLPTEPLFADPQTITVRGVELKACSAAAMFVHSVLHSTSRGAQLSTLPDVGRLARIVDPMDPIVAALLSGRSQRDLFVWSLQRAAQRIPIPERWHVFADEHQPSSSRRWLLDSIQGSEARLGLVNVLTGEQRLRRSAEMVWPADDYLRFKNRTRLGNLGWLARRAGQIVRGR
jgi:Uncharacterised nucleotidyltransferase